MAKNDTGKWVSRAAATGGSKTYGSRRPTNYYLAVGLVVVLGFASIAISRHGYRNPSSAQTVQPAVGKTWYAGYAISVCGTPQAALAANTTSTTGQTTTGEGVVKITPTAKSNAGNNATVGKFVTGYLGFSVTPQALVVPGTTATTYKKGDACPAGSPEAGKSGVVKVTYWPNLSAKSGKDITASFAKQKWAQNGLVTFSFGAADAKVAKPSQSTISAMLQGTTSSTSTTTATATTTVTPGSTAITVPVAPTPSMPTTPTSKP